MILLILVQNVIFFGDKDNYRRWLFAKRLWECKKKMRDETSNLLPKVKPEVYLRVSATHFGQVLVRKVMSQENFLVIPDEVRILGLRRENSCGWPLCDTRWVSDVMARKQWHVRQNPERMFLFASRWMEGCHQILHLWDGKSQEMLFGMVL